MSEEKPLSDKQAQPGAVPPPLTTAAMFAPGQREVVIVHEGEQYRLRQTRNGKLILTK